MAFSASVFTVGSSALYLWYIKFRGDIENAAANIDKRAKDYSNAAADVPWRVAYFVGAPYLSGVGVVHLSKEYIAQQLNCHEKGVESIGVAFCVGVAAFLCKVFVSDQFKKDILGLQPSIDSRIPGKTVLKRIGCGESEVTLHLIFGSEIFNVYVDNDNYLKVSRTRQGTRFWFELDNAAENVVFMRLGRTGNTCHFENSWGTLFWKFHGIRSVVKTDDERLQILPVRGKENCYYFRSTFHPDKNHRNYITVAEEKSFPFRNCHGESDNMTIPLKAGIFEVRIVS